MDRQKEIFKVNIVNKNERELTKLLKSGFNPNFEGGWPIRLAARHGLHSIVQLLMQYGANPHLLSEAGASTLQLAVFAACHWETDEWTFLLSCCDSSQLADGAAVAIIFNNVAALKKILQTGRCNANIPTTLTGKTVDDLARGYKLKYLLNAPVIQTNLQITPNTSPRVTRTDVRSIQVPHQGHRNLSPSVARFFDLTAGQPSLTSPRSPTRLSFSPTTQRPY
ncbi:uncharacterized protein LOC120636655 [Pararge aegeria]|uniref:Jg27708 protein n=2 Tax=Pararge aegeria TaxID=116150 RepID=A0A8S4R4C8_9NEOP|nr:uncharacterized protein LOC120636655 [Pararge aegeria]CAH2231400.1 jg27708 [Pararge aegeria aegeria]